MGAQLFRITNPCSLTFLYAVDMNHRVAMHFFSLQRCVIGQATIAICLWEECNSKNGPGGDKMQDVAKTITNSYTFPFVV